MALRKTVLIADDDEQLLEMLTARCRQIGLHPLPAETALDALLLLHDQIIDVAIVDVGMPCGDGLDVCERLVNDSALRSVPTIVLTGRKDAQTIRRCHRLAVYYVPKGSDVWPRVEPLLREFIGPSSFTGGNLPMPAFLPS